MYLRLLVMILTLLASAPLAMASDAPGNAGQAMAALQPLVGCWEGQGWMQRGPKERHTFSSRECVRPVLGGTALLVEGEHHALEGEGAGRIVHQALAVLRYLPDESRYQFHSWLADGREGDFRGELTEPGVFVWRMPTQGRMPEIRYTIQFNETSWKETGEMHAADGAWRPFFQMQLSRQ